jgi:ribosome-associated heat shock protein Hsp15
MRKGFHPTPPRISFASTLPLQGRVKRSPAFVEDYLQRQRLDKWLWHARVVRARASAAALIEAGHVRVNGVREKAPGHSVKAGDVVTVGLDRTVRVLKVTGFAERRGDASAAALLYDDLQQKRE